MEVSILLFPKIGYHCSYYFYCCPVFLVVILMIVNVAWGSSREVWTSVQLRVCSEARIVVVYRSAVSGVTNAAARNRFSPWGAQGLRL